MRLVVPDEHQSVMVLGDVHAEGGMVFFDSADALLITQPAVFGDDANRLVISCWERCREIEVRRTVSRPFLDGRNGFRLKFN